MELRAGDLERELARAKQSGLAGIYVIAGDEPLLVGEACDAILDAARAAGYAERTVLHAERDFDWNEVAQASASRSLFAERRIIDLRVRGASLADGAELLVQQAASASDTLVLVRAGPLDGNKRKSAWFRKLEVASTVVNVWPIEAPELPRWLERRLRAAGLACAPDALQAFADRVEGNLLAAVQEIDKLVLHDLPQPISRDDLLAVLGDAAHYDAFELVDAVLAGNAARVSRMIANLRQEGVAVFALQGAFVSQLHSVAEHKWIHPKRQQAVQAFLRRINGMRGIENTLAACALIDAQGKGQVPGDAWRSFEELLLRLCGVRVTGSRTGLALLHARS
jgi:DNA polymerase-3 subunit delta